MKKIDYISFSLSVIINLAILFLLAYKPFEKLDDIQAIKIGLVSLDTNASTQFKGEENRDAFKQNLDAKTIEENPVNEKNEKPEEKQEIAKENTKPEEKVIETEAEKNISEDKPKEVKKEKPSLSDLKKSISESKPNSKDLVKNSESFSPSSGDNVYVDRKLKATTDSNGLISGNIGGTSGNNEVQILWSNSNKQPTFPDRSKLEGKTGSMLIRIQVDQAGNILHYVIEEGSGVPEIDLAVEKVIGSWNLKMKKSNKIVAGVFLLDYSFDFK